MGGLCIAASEFYKTRHNIILSAGIFFVSAGKAGTYTERMGVWYLLLGLQAVSQGNELGLWCTDPRSCAQCPVLRLLEERADYPGNFQVIRPTPFFL